MGEIATSVLYYPGALNSLTSDMGPLNLAEIQPLDTLLNPTVLAEIDGAYKAHLTGLFTSN